MSNISLALALALASALLTAAGVIALIPVKYIHAVLERKRLERGTGIDRQSKGSQPFTNEEVGHRGLRHEVASALMRTYLHDRLARDHLQIAASTQSLHPLGPEDVLTQLIFVRRDINRMLREFTQSRSYGWSAFPSRSEYFHSIGEGTPRSELFAIKYFQYKTADLETVKPLGGPPRKDQSKRKAGAI